MAKKRKTRSQNNAQKQRQNIILAIIALVVIGAFALYGFSNRGLAYHERYDVEPVLGDPSAPVTIIEYGAYGCHACKAVHESGILDNLLEEFDGQVNLIFRDMPVISPQYDFMTAQLAQCVLDQSNDLFWAFHDLLYTVAEQSVSTREQLVSASETLGVDTDELNSCYDSGFHAGTVRYDQQRGVDAGVRGTPTFFINGQRLSNANLDAFRTAINNALASS